MRVKTTAILILLTFMGVTLSGCPSFKREPNSYYHLTVLDTTTKDGGDEDSPAIQTATVKNDLMRASIRPVVSFDGEKNIPLLLRQLLALQFLILEFTIENSSQKLIIYNPSHTAILAGKMDYKKPLDYAKLYFTVRNMSDKDTENARMMALRTIKGRFHDLNTRVEPGETVSKYLIFKPLDQDTLSGNAILKIQELYVGTEALAITFPLKVTNTPL